jgi:CDP-diacylglycerol--glycerol-3-phosphate 3-phosphatidyltransferase
VLTTPNALTGLRMVGTIALPPLAYFGHRDAFVWLLVALLLTDWLDGKIAILFELRTPLGARLDSLADIILYAALVPSVWWLRPEFVRSDAALLALTLLSYVISAIVGLARFGRLPAYHTRAAKTCWLLIGIGAVVVFAGGPSWPIRIALVAVILTNLEATAISLVLPEWKTDVVSIYHALRSRGGPPEPGAPDRR